MKIKNVIRASLLALVVSGLSVPAMAATNEKPKVKPSFDQYVATIKAEAIAKGYDEAMVNEALTGLTYRKKVVKADKNQPERIQTLDTYLPKRVNDWVVKKARNLYKDNKTLLDNIGEKYGVQPRFIIALWGLESAFGKYTGSNNVFASLTTLAYEGRRESLYRPQIFAALEIIKRGENTVAGLKGSWAGAMGQTQFMPTSYLNYAVDYDGDGKKDIWHTQADVFASIANYLKTEGWNSSMTWGRQVTLPPTFNGDESVAKGSRSLKQWLGNYKAAEKSLADWSQMGVLRTNGTALPLREMKAALVLPDDKEGRAYLAYNNFKTLMHWNRSYYFVTSVGHLADRIGFPAIK
ncbi:MAG: membrane-bound lytic murein transglycosylase B [Phenylobacterium sp.]|jgi:membrane-bound lytic murein transglycosylase B